MTKATPILPELCISGRYSTFVKPFNVKINSGAITNNIYVVMSKLFRYKRISWTKFMDFTHQYL